MIAFFSHDDLDMVSCKSGTWWELNPHFGRANNSAVLVREEIKLKEYLALGERIIESGAGEPAVYFTNDREVLSNPCVEATLRPHSFCVAGDTHLITKDGICRIKDVVGTPVTIWNGEEWTTVTPFQTGTADRLHRVYFNDGSYLDATDNHRFLVKRTDAKAFKEYTTLELHKFTKYPLKRHHVPLSNVIPSDIGIEEEYAYDYGMVLGNRFNPHRFSGSEEYIKNRKLGRLFTPLIIKDTSHLDAAMCEQLTRGDTIPPILFTWSHASILKFLAGFADGNAMPFKCGYRFYGIESQLRELQLLLTKHGIFTSIHPRSSAVIKPPYEKNEWCMRVFYLIGLEVKRATQVFSYPISIPNMSQVIIKVEELPGTHESFCVTEPKLHQCVFNNVLTKQCNLTELNVSDLHDQDEFNERARAAAFIGTLQASYTNFHYIRPCWKKATEEDALLGVSMTGIASGGVMELDQVQAAAVVVYENERVASRLNINTAARTTLTKPSGCFDESTPIKTTTGIKSLHEIFKLNGIDPYTTDIGFHEIKEMVLVYDMNNIAQPITRLFNNGVEETLSIEFEDGVVINCTSNHRFLTTEGWKRADELTEHSDVIHF